MAYRLIHDDIPHSTTLGQLSDAAERLYVRMLAVTDQWGRLTGDLRKLRLVTIPSLAWDDDKLHRTVTELTRAGAIDHYEEQGTSVIQIVNFDDRQLCAKAKRAPSRFDARTVHSLSPDDLALSLPLSTNGPEACAPARSLSPNGGLEACDLSLSDGGLRNGGAEKCLQNLGSTRQKTEDRRERGLPTAVVRPAANALSVSQTIEAALARDDSRTGLTLVPFVDVTGASARDVPAGEVGLEPGTAEWLLERLGDRDDGTLNVLAALRRELPSAAFVCAAESLEERRGRSDRPVLRSDVRYVVSALKTMVSEGTYRPEGAAA